MTQRMLEERSLGELFSGLARETGTLVSKEVQLAKVEMTLKAKVAGREAAVVAIGGAITVLGAFALISALIFGLATFMPLWASALLVGVVVTSVGGILASLGIRALKDLGGAPHQTIATFKENERWLNDQLNR
jgi:hypothetical protein